MARTRFAEGDGSIERARSLRRTSTIAEQAFWAAVRGSAINGWKFRRQQRLGPYVADFVCQSKRLVIEIDGETHAHSVTSDAERTAFLEREGYRVLRFTNADVLDNITGVIVAMTNAIADAPSPSHPAVPGGPLPLPHGERRA